MVPKELNDDEKAFLLYCKIGSIDLVKNYIDDIRFNVNFKDKDGNSPLHIAAINNKKEVFKELINAEAKTDIKNDKGERAIDIALLKCCEENNKELVIDLIGLGADINCKDLEGNTPLHYAAQEDGIKVFKELFKAGELHISKNNYGETPRLDKLLLSDYKEYELECKDLLEKMGASLDFLDPKNNDAIFTKYLIEDGVFKIEEKSPELLPRYGLESESLPRYGLESESSNSKIFGSDSNLPSTTIGNHSINKYPNRPRSV